MPKLMSIYAETYCYGISGNIISYSGFALKTTSLVITTNKSPAEWAKSLNDETLATALLDRLLYKCQLIQLQGKSYRMQNRKTIFSYQEE